MKKYCVYALVMFAFGCKPQQKLTTTSKPIGIDSVQIDSPELMPEFFITQLNDTIYDLTTEVEVSLKRLMKDTISIIGVGDIMMGTNFPAPKYLPGNNGNNIWLDVSDTLRQADITFGNLEGVILDEGGDQKNCKNPRICYLFRTPESYIENLVTAGFDVVSLANNHASDFGEIGRVNTMETLDSVGINYAGLESSPKTSFKKDGIKYGFAAFAPNKGTVNFHDIDQAKSLVKELDSLNDIVIVSFHGGAEGSKHEHVTRETEMFYGENRGNVYEFAHDMIDAGADIIFGHGPHVTRAIDLYKDRFIIYSLGNFCTYGRFNLRGVNGIAPIIKVYTNSEGKFLKGEIIPAKQIGAGIPKIDDYKAAITKLQDLTKKDFPEINLKIEDSGIINYLDN